MEESKNLKHWKQKRSIFRWVASATMGLYGMEDLTSVVILFFLMERHHLSHKDAVFYYSLTEMIFCAVQAGGSLILGRFADSTRNIRLILMLNLVICCACNLLYTLPLPLWIVLGARGFMGITESLQPTIVGEIRRVYDTSNEELINALTWIYISNTFGRNLGAIVIFSFTKVSFNIGDWVIDRLIAGNLFISIFAFILLILTYFKISNVSKELDEIKLTHHQTPKEASKPTTNKSLMKWTDLFNKDILSIIISFGLIRFMALVYISNTTTLTATKYGWNSSYVFILFFSTNAIFSFLAFGLIQSKILENQDRSFYIYVLAICSSAIVLISFMLTKTDLLDTFAKQIIFFTIMKFVKFYGIYLGNVCSSFLLLGLVNSKDSSFISGVNSFFSVIMKGTAYIISFEASFYPEYFYPPAIIVLLTLAQFMLCRSGIYV
ncbi:uncharacterized protein [Clytia hemisphaerica]|uniref:Uncharacterized protein n=1 Tax=Clytia hemisphaerica TaxID=252671 RepID=A0A7M5X6S9_9CNID